MRVYKKGKKKKASKNNSKVSKEDEANQFSVEV